MQIMEHRGISRKTFLMYLLQFPLFGGIAKYLYGFKPQKCYLLNKFSVAGFCFYEGPNLLACTDGHPVPNKVNFINYYLKMFLIFLL